MGGAVSRLDRWVSLDRPPDSGRGDSEDETARRAGRRVGFESKWKPPRVGFEPTTYRLTAGRSTVELSGNQLSDKHLYHPRRPCLGPGTGSRKSRRAVGGIARRGTANVASPTRIWRKSPVVADFGAGHAIDLGLDSIRVMALMAHSRCCWQGVRMIRIGRILCRLLNRWIPDSLAFACRISQLVLGVVVFSIEGLPFEQKPGPPRVVSMRSVGNGDGRVNSGRPIVSDSGHGFDGDGGERAPEVICRRGAARRSCDAVSGDCDSNAGRDS